jgi:phosphorylcholine metabolism protein LicD
MFNIYGKKIADVVYIKILKEFVYILDTIKFNKYFLSGGNLLGVIRKNKFLKWDNEIDFECLSTDLRKVKNLLVKKFIKKGFRVKCKSYNNKYNKIAVFKNNFKISLGSFEVKNSKFLVSKINILPIAFFKNIKKIKFNGITLNVPENPEKYLSYVYKNWKVEIRGRFYYNLQYYRSDTLYSFIYKLRRFLLLVAD